MGKRIKRSAQTEPRKDLLVVRRSRLSEEIRSTMSTEIRSTMSSEIRSTMSEGGTLYIDDVQTNPINEGTSEMEKSSSEELEIPIWIGDSSKDQMKAEEWVEKVQVNRC